MAQSDRMFLDEVCPTLHEKLKENLLDSPGAEIEDTDFQDFEMSYLLSARQDTTLFLKVSYEYLAPVLKAGSQAFLERTWQGLPIKGVAGSQDTVEELSPRLPGSGLKLEPNAGSLLVAVDAPASLGEAERQRCMRVVSLTRTWLLIGPLVERLRWLRDAAASGKAAAKNAAPGNQAAEAAKAVGEIPPMITLQLRRSETCWIIAKPDRVIVITSIHFDDDVDKTLAKTFCQEFADSGRGSATSALPCSFMEMKNETSIPADLRDVRIPEMPNVGFLTMTLGDQIISGVSDDQLHTLAVPVMTLRNFFHFHLKHAKSYLHSRLRRRIDTWQGQMTGPDGARRVNKIERGQRRLATGKVFNPQSRPVGAK